MYFSNSVIVLHFWSPLVPLKPLEPSKAIVVLHGNQVSKTPEKRAPDPFGLNFGGVLVPFGDILECVFRLFSRTSIFSGFRGDRVEPGGAEYRGVAALKG